MKNSKGMILPGIILTGIIFVYPLIKTPKYSTKACSQFKTLFWKTSLTQKLKNSEVECLQKHEKQEGLSSFFVPQNFENVRCPAKQIGFAKSAMPQVALASFPGSGNTWLRHLIEYISGTATGSIYCDALRKTFIAECKKDTTHTIAIKTHKSARDDNMKLYDKVILIIRNPFDAILAQFNLMHSNHTSLADRETFNSREWVDSVKRLSTRWRKHALSWLTKFKGPLHVVSYENLIQKFYEEMLKLATFLDVKMTFSDAWCAGRNREGSYHRVKPDWMTASVLYSSELRDVVRSNIQTVSDTLHAFGITVPFLGSNGTYTERV